MEKLPLGRRKPNRRGVLDDGRYAAAVTAGLTNDGCSNA